MKRVLTFAALFLMLLQPAVAFAAETKTVNVKPSTLSAQNQTQCQRNGAYHFVMTDMSHLTAPASIRVTYTNGTVEDVPLLSVQGNNAQYDTSSHITLTILNATAVVKATWDGNFNLSCGSPTAVTLSSFSAESAQSGDILGFWMTALAVLLVLIGIVGLAALAIFLPMPSWLRRH